MSEGQGTRVLLMRPDRPITKTAIDWVAERQSHARVIVPPAARQIEGLPGRLAHEPFTDPEARAAESAGAVATILSATGKAAAWAVEAGALALLEGGAVIATNRDDFRDLIPLSSWSMNVPERPTDGLLVHHLGIAGRMPAALGESAPEAFMAILEGDAGRIQRVLRARRLAARGDGPVRFRRIAKKSAGLRPFVVYIDLFPLAAGAGPAFTSWLGGLERERAESLLSTAAAIFI